MSCLYVVATPIGNLGDLSPRAIQILSQVKLIFAEDTRHSAKLMAHFGIGTPLLSLHEHNESQRIELIRHHLFQGDDLALISDAGTPLISDPGFTVVRALRQDQACVIPIPGASALISALSVCGLPTNRFCFEGFLSAKSTMRRQQLQALMDETRTLIFYESSHRFMAFLEDLNGIFGHERLVFIGREMTKRYESYLLAPVAELKHYFSLHPEEVRGEFVVIVEGAQTSKTATHFDAERLLTQLIKVLPLKKAVDIVSEVSQEKRNALYEKALQIKNTLDS